MRPNGRVLANPRSQTPASMRTGDLVKLDRLAVIGDEADKGVRRATARVKADPDAGRPSRGCASRWAANSVSNWPVAVLALGFIVTGVWIGFLLWLLSRLAF